MIQVYIGDGKGKTTAAIGAALRAIGNGKKVVFFQFLKKGKFKCGEEKILKSLKNIKFIKFDEPSPVFNYNIDLNKLKNKSRKHINKAIKIINSGKYDLIILDEIIYHFKYEIFNIKDFLKKIKYRPEFVEIILTGRYKIKELLKNSDLITEMKKIKHPFDKGIKARKGIEF